MYLANFCPDDCCWRVTTDTGLIVQLCQSLPDALAATVEAGQVNSESRDFHEYATRSLHREWMRNRIERLRRDRKRKRKGGGLWPK